MPTIGQRFKEARERKPATLSQAGEATRIKSSQLEAMEHDDFSRMGAAIYAKGFIRLYSEYLGLDPAPLVREYTERNGPQVEKPVLTPESAPRVFRKKPPSPELAPPFELPLDAPDADPGAPSSRPSILGPESGDDRRFALDPALLRAAIPAALALAAVGVVVLLILWIVRACSGSPAVPAPGTPAVAAPAAVPARIVPAAETPKRPEGPSLLIGEPPAPYLEFNAAPAPAPAGVPARDRRP